MSDTHFGEWLKRQISELPATYSGFARMAGIPVSSLNTWFRCEHPGIRADNVTRLARTLGIHRTEIEHRLRHGRTSSAA
jgi:predicted transcriptional regulator